MEKLEKAMLKKTVFLIGQGVVTALIVLSAVLTMKGVLEDFGIVMIMAGTWLFLLSQFAKASKRVRELRTELAEKDAEEQPVSEPEKSDGQE